MTGVARTTDAPNRFPGIEAFEALAIDPAEFDHEAHIYVAWAYLRRMELLHAIDRYRSTLRRLTVKLGVPGKYHETITWFFMIAVADRMQASPHDDWTAFRQANGDLFEPQGAFLKVHYTGTLLNSERARSRFVLPDRLPHDS